MTSAWGSSFGNAWGASWGQTASLTAPSGMRRLMLYALQEEVLNNWGKPKDEQKQGQEAPSRESEAPQAKPVAAPAAKPKRPRRQRVAEPTTHERVIPFRRRREPATIAPSVPELLSAIPKLHYNLFHFRQATLNVISLEHERKQRRARTRRRAAAFLLLAA